MAKHVVIIGGGLAGLSAGVYARASGFETTILEHHIALGGVCTAWRRGEYAIDGCIHWLTGGPFKRLYEELSIVPNVELRTLDRWVTWQDSESGAVIPIGSDLAALGAELTNLAPEDAAEIARLLTAANRFADMQPPGVKQAPELTTFREQLHMMWEMKGSLGTMLHFRKPIGVYAREHLRSDTLRRLLGRLVPSEAPALFLLMVLGYLHRGYLSRPVGGSGRFRDALIASYEALGGRARMHTTVEEVLVRDGRATGVRLTDGTIVAADAVISTSSAPETILRLLGGRYCAEETRERLAHWKLFQPIVLTSFGVSTPLAALPPMLIVDGIAPFEMGGRKNDHLYLRTYNDDASLAPEGHAVVQAMFESDYEWWATRGSDYDRAKEDITARALAQIQSAIPAVANRVRMTDIATPLTYWSMARSWRGAYEGWMPNGDSMFGHVRKTLPGLEAFYMAGQWVEPGGGVPMAIMSGRQSAQLLCAAEGVPFVAGSHRSTR